MGILVFAFNADRILKEVNKFREIGSLDEVSRQLPQGVYTTFRTYGGSKKVLGLRAHLDRLYGPAGKFGLDPCVSEGELRSGLKNILMVNEFTESRVRICLSLNEQPGSIFVMIEPLRPINEHIYQNGVKVVTSEISRTNPRLKTTSFISNSAEERKALLTDEIYEILMVKNNRIYEGITSNFYALINGTIVTARDGILLGVTRKVVLGLIRKQGISIHYKALRIDELSRAEEAFITSSSRGIVPVIMVDGKPIGQGAPGIYSKLLRTKYEAYVMENAEEI